MQSVFNAAVTPHILVFGLRLSTSCRCGTGYLNCIFTPLMQNLPSSLACRSE